MMAMHYFFKKAYILVQLLAKIALHFSCHLIKL